MILSYTKDICGNDLLTDENENQIMMEWEKPYMEACIDYLDIYGSVLEVGFGLGYSARRICSSPYITEYNVIECSPVVFPVSSFGLRQPYENYFQEHLNLYTQQK